MQLPAPLEREWLWSALESLLSRRGEAWLLEAPIVLPSDQFFPDRWSPDEAGVAAIAARLLGYAGLGHLTVSIATSRFYSHRVGNTGTMPSPMPAKPGWWQRWF